MPVEITAPNLSYEQINQEANKFLEQYWKSGTIPVDIERIAEFDFHLNIFPFPNLQNSFDVEGFLSGDLTTLYIDEFVYDQRPTRYRFSIAHEIGHIILHRAIIESIYPRSVSGWRDFMLNVDPGTYGSLEYQAYVFAAATLMPRLDLQKLFAIKKKALQPNIDDAESKGLSLEVSQNYIINAIASELFASFDVSNDAAVRRITKEIERRHLSLV